MRRRRKFERAGLVLELDMEAPVRLGDTADLVEEIHVPGAAAELAVGDALEAELGLHRDRLFDAVILAAAQGLGCDPALLMLGPRRQKRLRAQQAADMIGAKRRTGIIHCASSTAIRLHKRPGVLRHAPRLRRGAAQDEVTRLIALYSQRRGAEEFPAV